MPLQSALPGLQQDIEAAFKKLRDNAKKPAGKDGDNSDQVIAEVAQDLAMAIHNYVMQAQVITSGGGPVTGFAGPLAPVGVCPIVGGAVTSSTGNLV